MLLLLLPLLAAAAAALVVPGPSGPFSVALRVRALTDTSRRDPLDPTGSAPHRRLLVSLFLPVNGSCPLETIPYMTPSVADAYAKQAASEGLPVGNLFRSLELQFCHLSRPPSARYGDARPRFPLVLFTPGLADSRLLYSVMARSLASRGYVVVTVDHPYEAPSVEFPDRSVVACINVSGADPAAIRKVVEVRSDDLSFVLDQLRDPAVLGPLLAQFPGAVDPARAVVVGHSIGGAAAALVLERSPAGRLLGAVDLDGQLLHDLVRPLGPLRRLLLLAGRPAHRAQDPTWDAFWPLAGPRAELAIAGTAHASFTDRPLLISATFPGDALPAPARDALVRILGTIDAHRLDTVLNAVLASFFDLALDGKAAPLRAIDNAFPEVSFTRSHL